MISGKKANFSIVLLVIMTFMIVGIALYTYLVYSSMSGKNIIDIGFMGDTYLKEDYARFYISQVMQQISDDKISGSEVQAEFKARLGKINDELLSGIKERVLRDDFSLSLEPGKLVFEMKDVLFSGKAVKPARNSGWISQSASWIREKTGLSEKDISGEAIVNYRVDIVVLIETE